MSTEGCLPFHIFDDEADVSIVERRLPHWSQVGAIAFITFRTDDSMPKAVLDKWFAERACWLREHGIDPTAGNWRDRLQQLDYRAVRLFRSALEPLARRTRCGTWRVCPA